MHPCALDSNECTGINVSALGSALDPSAHSSIFVHSHQSYIQCTRTIALSIGVHWDQCECTHLNLVHTDAFLFTHRFQCTHLHLVHSHGPSSIQCTRHSIALSTLKILVH